MVLDLEAMVIETSGRNECITCTNINNNNKVFTASTAPSGLANAPQQHQGNPAPSVRQPETCDGNINTSASGQQGIVLSTPPAYSQHNQFQNYPPQPGYPPPPGYPPQQGYPPQGYQYQPYQPQQGYQYQPQQSYQYQPQRSSYGQYGQQGTYAQSGTYDQSPGQGRYYEQNVTTVYTVPAQRRGQEPTVSVIIIKKFYEDPKQRNAFIRKVYAILLLQLLVCVSAASICVFVDPVHQWVLNHFYLMYLWLFFYLACAIVMCCCLPQLFNTNPLSVGLLIVLTLSMSAITGFISSKHGKESVVIALGTTALVVFLLTLLAFQTSYDFTTWIGGMFVVLIIFVLFAFFVVILRPYMPIINLVYACLGALIMSVYIVIDTQTLMSGKRYALDTDMYILGAISLFVDIVLLFLYVLQIVDNSK